MEEVQKKEKNWKFCSGFILKIIAFVTMTIDHIGVMAESSYGITGTWVDIFRVIGRIAMPLFCFMIVEGVIHTKSFAKYALRLGILTLLIAIALLLLVSIEELGFSSVRDFGNIFIDLLMGALTIFCLRLPKFKKLFALLPVAFIFTSFFVTRYEVTNGTLIHWFPYFIRSQYELMSLAFILVFYLAYVIKDLFFSIHNEKYGLPKDTFNGTDLERTVVNVISLLLFITTVLVFHFFSDYLTNSYMDVQIFALLSGAFILLYNGKRGYNSKWFEYGGYAYYPLHILIIALIFYLISL